MLSFPLNDFAFKNSSFWEEYRMKSGFKKDEASAQEAEIFVSPPRSAKVSDMLAIRQMTNMRFGFVDSQNEKQPVELPFGSRVIVDGVPAFYAKNILQIGSNPRDRYAIYEERANEPGLYFEKSSLWIPIRKLAQVRAIDLTVFVMTVGRPRQPQPEVRAYEQALRLTESAPLQSAVA